MSESKLLIYKVNFVKINIENFKTYKKSRNNLKKQLLRMFKIFFILKVI